MELDLVSYEFTKLTFFIKGIFPINLKLFQEVRNN